MLLYIVLLALPALALGQGLPASLKPYNQTAMEYYMAVDTNGDGIVSRDEKHQYYLRYDTNNNGEISRHEFTTAIDADSSHFKGHEMQLFDHYDINVDGHLTESDIFYVFEINDLDRDGILTEIEFVLYWALVFEALDS